MDEEEENEAAFLLELRDAKEISLREQLHNGPTCDPLHAAQTTVEITELVLAIVLEPFCHAFIDFAFIVFSMIQVSQKKLFRDDAESNESPTKTIPAVLSYLPITNTQMGEAEQTVRKFCCINHFRL